MAAYLECVDLYTGQHDRAYAAQIPEALHRAAATAVQDVGVTGEGVLELDGWPITLHRETVDSDSVHVGVWRLTDRAGDTVGHVAVARKSRPGARVWRSLHERLPNAGRFATTAEDRPGAPWLAVACPGVDRATGGPNITLVARVIGWAWMEHRDL